MSDEPAQERRLLLVLDDAMVASIWAAVALMALTLLGFVLLITMRPTLVSLIADLSGVTTSAMAIIWVCGVTLLKLTAISFAAIAFGLWIWRRRLSRRIAESKPSPS
jgi:hypothetical protein